MLPLTRSASRFERKGLGSGNFRHPHSLSDAEGPPTSAATFPLGARRVTRVLNLDLVSLPAARHDQLSAELLADMSDVDVDDVRERIVVFLEEVLVDHRA